MKFTTKVIRYGVVGATAFVIDYGVTLFFLERAPLLVANTIGFLTANCINFLMAHRWVFEYEGWKIKVWTTYLSVLGVSVIGLALNDLVVWILVGVAGVSLLPGKVAATTIVMAWNFSARLLWVYKKAPAS